MQPEIKTNSKVIKVEDLVPILGIGRNMAYALVRSGQIRSIRIGRCYRIPLSAVDEYLDGKKTA